MLGRFNRPELSACQAVSLVLPVAPDIGVLRRVLMPFRAVSFAPLMAVPTEDIFRTGDRLKMVRPDTISGSAEVVKFQSDRDWPHQQFIEELVGKCSFIARFMRLALQIKHAIAARILPPRFEDATPPEPAGRSKLHLVDKSVDVRLTQHWPTHFSREVLS